MRAVILAAGIGKRLEAMTDARPPKCLLRFGGKSLLERQLGSLRRHGVTDVVVVTGYAAELVEAEIEALRLDPRPLTVKNPDFERGSVVSLWCAREHLARGGEIVLMDADVLFDDRVLSRLLRAPRSDLILLDRDFEAGEEPVKLCIKKGVAVEFRKRVPEDLEFDDAGESVGFFRFSGATARRLSKRTAEYVDGGRRDEPHEEAIRDLVLETPERFSFEDVSGLPWIEIDFPEDVRRAERDILPRLTGVPA